MKKLVQVDRFEWKKIRNHIADAVQQKQSRHARLQAIRLADAEMYKKFRVRTAKALPQQLHHPRTS